jgi:hypothetical protein
VVQGIVNIQLDKLVATARQGHVVCAQAAFDADMTLNQHEHSDNEGCAFI